ncbi:peptidoglycan-binding protein [Archangium lansingense]|uniref:peptidoglycan-binding protein n=1 Tax=Archangium lansingense TaxID=2995310 RepID=UPI003B82B8CD
MATPAPAARQALKDANARWPRRKKASDGIMGDARHQRTKSDHNVGNAVDITHDPASGATGTVVAQHALKDNRVTYVIWNKRINSRDGRGWRPYRGSNPHTHHCHISIRAAARNDTRHWGWVKGPGAPRPSPKPPPPAGMPTRNLKRGMQGPDVKQLQAVLVKLGHMTQAQLNTGPGIFGPQTQQALKQFQAKHGVPATGFYGPLTRAAFAKLGAKPGGAKPRPKPAPKPAKGGVTLAQLKAIMPHLTTARATQCLPHLNRAMQEAGITTRKRRAAFLAQLAHESGELRYFEELASGAAYEGRKDLGNIRPGDGRRFKGRGPIQLTGRNNYRAAGNALKLDLVNHPKRAAAVNVGFRTAGWFWNTRKLNRYADQGNFREITRRINGGFNGLAHRQAFYSRALKVLA